MTVSVETAPCRRCGHRQVLHGGPIMRDRRCIGWDPDTAVFCECEAYVAAVADLQE